MILIITLYAASIVASLGLSFLFVSILLERSNSYGSQEESSPSMKRFKVMDVNQTKL
ncbi:MAG: hypothetical protein J5752_01355 [Clostridiales bacterium]|nr:hypothetical protein [Clostridiales bacterium]